VTDAAQRVTVAPVPKPDPLVVALLEGDWDAWGRMVDAHAASMRAVARNKTGNDDLAEEAVQDAFADVMTAGVDNLVNVRNLGSYLRGITANKAVDIIRSRVRNVSTDPDKFTAAADIHQISPDDAVGDSNDIEIAVGLIDEMTPKVAYAIRERVMNGRPAAEVAAEIPCDPSHIAKLVKRGLDYIRQHPWFTNASDPEADDATSVEDTHD
jgi:RNA polymerase sigma factor (sigma-70 family)